MGNNSARGLKGNHVTEFITFNQYSMAYGIQRNRAHTSGMTEIYLKEVNWSSNNLGLGPCSFEILPSRPFIISQLLLYLETVLSAFEPKMDPSFIFLLLFPATSLLLLNSTASLASLSTSEIKKMTNDSLTRTFSSNNVKGIIYSSCEESSGDCIH